MRSAKTKARARVPYCCVMLLTVMIGSLSAEESLDSYLKLDLNDLLSKEISSVSKKAQPLAEVAAAVFVITQNDIQRAGVTSIPEALRLAPGLQVAKFGSNRWAISSRGFNNQFANKLLVLIDGRSVYTPSYSAVYWDVQDTILEDIERIEVIRGPGATLWGANAVNGVINIITKQASKTSGGLLVVGAGDEERSFAHARYGADLGKNIQGRVYVKYGDHDSSYSPSLSGDAGDDWRSVQAGFRVDGLSDRINQWTVQGDIYDIDKNQIVASSFLDPFDPANSPPNPDSPYIDINREDNFDASGWNLTGRWNRQHSANSASSLQVYYDKTDRDELGLGQYHKTLDIDFQHQFDGFEGHEIIWGLGYRWIDEKFRNSFGLSFDPNKDSRAISSAFLQDEIKLTQDSLRLTIGSKLERNDSTGVNFQPNLRLLWLASESQSLWTSISRAVRTPSRIELAGSIVGAVVPIGPSPIPPLIISVTGSDDLDVEELDAIELGYRVQLSERLSLDLALFQQEYNNLTTIELESSSLVFTNSGNAKTRGLELAVDWRPREWWRLQANYTYLSIAADSEIKNGIGEYTTVAVIENSSPEHQWSIRSATDLPNNWSLDLWAYYVHGLGASSFTDGQVVSDYTSINARLAWRPNDNIELSLVGRNLQDKRHLEFIPESTLPITDVDRSIYVQVQWSF